MTQRHSVTRWLALGGILLLVGLVSQGAALAQTPLAETQQKADQGDADAQYRLGIAYDFGQGVPQDDSEAVTWYRQAADQGHAAAQYNLALMYRNGEGVPEDDTEAVARYRQAADQGLADAMYNLGFMYQNSSELAGCAAGLRGGAQVAQPRGIPRHR